MARLDDYDVEKRFGAVVKKSTRITPETSDEEVREIVLEVQRPDFDYELGQSIGVLVPGPHEFGNEYHHRLYSVADLPKKSGKNPLVTIVVKRCTYIDDYSGERYDGVASHYLCNRAAGDKIMITGPFGLPFEIPDDDKANLLLIGMGTGIAPFRALVKKIYNQKNGFKGKVRLFYGAKSGLELLYMNDKKDDFTNYYDEETFEAFKALSPRPHWADPIALDYALREREEEVWRLMEDPHTHVFVAGLEPMRDMLDSAFSEMAGGQEKWERRKAELKAGKRWMELIY